DRSPTGYRLEAHLTQQGAGIESLASSRYDDEAEPGVPGKQPLQLIHRDPAWPPSLALTLTQVRKPPAGAPAADAETRSIDPTAVANAEDWLESVIWEVVRDDRNRIVHPESRVDPVTQSAVEGQSVTFRTKVPDGMVLTKTFRLWQNTDGLEVEIKFESP